MANLVVWGVYVYLGVGLAVAGLFLFFGIERVDASSRGAYAFRPLLIPGLMLLWPLVLRRWRGAAP